MDKDTNVLYKRDDIYSFSPNKSRGSWFTHFLNHRDYYKIHDEELIEIIIKVTDEDNNPIDFNGEKCLFTLEVSKRDLDASQSLSTNTHDTYSELWGVYNTSLHHLDFHKIYIQITGCYK